ncbi:unnamed protein product [Rotaria sp. Silwood2]|nr:unnamed protein product [Rotaria sp. Silwood2]CAF4060962.1 unnamed protein product [Rotaria sp. Silwood2]
MAMKYSDATGVHVRICDFSPEPQRILLPIKGFEKKPLVSLEQSVEPLISIVPHINQMVWTVKANCHQPENGLTEDESASIMLYTLEWIPKEKSCYYILNSTLRSQNRSQLIPWFRYLRLFTSALLKLPSMVPKILYRGVERNMRKEFPVGKKFIWWSFTSCTSSFDVLETYLGKAGQRTIFNIICDSAKDISQHALYQTENEFLLYPARQFTVTSSLYAGNGLQIIHIKETQSRYPLFRTSETSSFTSANMSQIPNPKLFALFSDSLTTSLILSQSIGTFNEKKFFTMSRKAIDSSGRLGSLYDGYKDLILGTANMNSKEKQCQALKSNHCMIINGSKDKKLNILQMIGVENELRLSTLLNIREKTGIAAINDYSYPINEYTRFFYYSYLDREEQFSNNPPKIQSSDESFKRYTVATHIIIGIQTGIDIIIVLQLPSNKKLVTKIDHILHRIRNLLLDDENIFTLTLDDENLLENIILTKIYSNILDVQNMKRLYDICRYIKQNQNKTVNYPLSYTLQPIKWLYSTYTGPGNTFIALPVELIDNIEQNIFQLRDDIMKLEISLKQDLPKLLNGYLKERLSDLQKHWLNTKNKYINEIEQLAKLVIDFRSGRIPVQTVHSVLNTKTEALVKTMIHDLTQNLNDLTEKGHFISDLCRQQFRYLNAVEYDIDQTDNEKTIERKLVMNDQPDYILCSTDTLNKLKSEQLRQLRRDAIEKLKNNFNLRLIYADFSYCSFELKNMMILPLNK